MRRKSWFLTFLLATGLALPTCEILGPPCDCPRPLGEFFDIQEMTVNQRATIGCCVLVVEEGATIPFSDYQGMEIKYGVEYIAQSRPAPRVRGLSLMGSLLACDCVENGWQGAKTESLANLTVTTLHDFSDIYLAGDTINDLLTVLDMGQPVALPAYLSRPATLIQEESLWLNLTEAPASGEDFQAEVTVTLSNGEVYTARTAAIKLEE